MVSYTSKRMTLGVKSDTIHFYIMENLNERTHVVGGEVSSTEN
jgi:hypothetical protein